MTNIVGTKVTIVAGSDIFRIAGQSTADEYQWHGRLLNEIAISEAFQVVGNTPSTQSINIDNHDSFIAANIELWGATVVIETDSGKSWHGKINAYDYDGSGVLRISATERAAPEYEIQIPDEVMRLGDVDQNLHVSFANFTLPTVIGGNTTTPILIQGILAHKEDGVYLLCVGEIHQIVKVYRGTEEITTGFTAYVGALSQASYAGAAYVQITDEDLRLNDDGTYAEISAEVIGLKLGNHTIEECRNGARFLYYLLTTAATGEGGWGVGVDPTEIDTDSFNSAIASVDAAGLKLDGVMYFRQKAQSWIDQICQSIRGSYKIGADGKRSLWVNSNRASVKTFGREIQVERYGKGTFTGRVYNKGKLDYGYNPITGQFMQSAQYEDTVSITAIGEHEFYGQSHLIADAATAQKILEYNCKKSLVGASKAYFSVAELEASIKVGDVITIDRADLDLFGTFQITSLDTTDFISTIEAERFSSDIFTSGTPGTKIEWGNDADIASPVSPGIASGLTLSSEVRQTQDGTNIVVLKGTFTLPDGRYTAAAIEYGRVISPATDPDPWLNMGMIQGNFFEIAPILPATMYKVRIRMITSTDHSDYITSTITTQGDTVAPGIPTIGAGSNLKIVTIRCVLSQAPSDMAGFKFYRSTANNSDNAVYIGSQASKDGSAVFVDNAPDYRQFYYFVRSFDTWGNMSAFSASVAITTYGVSSADIIADAIKVPLGSILRLTADGCTTASIAEVDGVIDASGNANHGRAYGGVTVVDDAHMGKVFNFDGINDYIGFDSDIPTASEITLCAWVKSSTDTTILRGIMSWYSRTSTARKGIMLNASGNTRLLVSYGNNGPSAVSYYITCPTLLQTRFISITANATTGNIKIYFDGQLIDDRIVTGLTLNADIPVVIGRSVYYYNGQFFNGLIYSPVFYTYELTETQVRSLYQCPQQIVTGTITGDRVGANTIVARNLVKTEALITESAQIDDLIVTDAHIQNLSGNKITANSITTDKLLVGSSGGCLNDDPNFLDASQWGPSDVHPSHWHQCSMITITDGVVGNNCMRSNGYGIFISKQIAISRNKVYRVQAWAKGVAAENKYIYTGLYCYDSAGVNLGHIYAAHPMLTNFWQPVVGAIAGSRFPAGTKFVALFSLLGYQSTAGNYHYMQDFRLEEVIGSTLIQDGAITTSKLNANAVKSLNYIPPTSDNRYSNAGSFFNLADGTITSKNFYVDSVGNVGIKGHVEATSGEIGSFTIQDGSLRATNSNSGWVGIRLDGTEIVGDETRILNNSISPSRIQTTVDIANNRDGSRAFKSYALESCYLLLYDNKTNAAGTTIIDNRTSIHGATVNLTSLSQRLKLSPTEIIFYDQNDNRRTSIFSTTPVVAAHSYNATSWFRQYSDGFVDQGGLITLRSGGGYITLPIPISTSLAHIDAHARSGNPIDIYRSQSDTTRFRVTLDYNLSEIVFWRATGKKI